MHRKLALAVLALTFALSAPAQYRDSNWQERDQWQRPAAVLDALALHGGSNVADVGAGPGYFTMRMAERVGPTGKVYAVDISEDALRELKDKLDTAGLKQVQTIHSTPNDPRLPPESLDAALIVNAYHEFREHDAMLQGILRALKPGGVLGIIDKDAPAGKKRREYEDRHELPPSFVRDDLTHNGFTNLHDLPGFDPTTSDRQGEHWWFLVATKPAPTANR
jgi:ubiquinone/menaquinone biosynthesis C-methylase UbiE